MEKARAVLERLDRIDALRRADTPAAELLGEVRSLLSEAEDWLREDPGTDARASVAVERCRDALASP